LSAILPKVEALLRFPDIRPPPDPKPSWYDPSQFCDYHRVEGHSTDGCMALKHAIQRLIDQGAVKVETASASPPSGPAPPFPNHRDPSSSRVNMISSSLSEEIPVPLDSYVPVGPLPSVSESIHLLDLPPPPVPHTSSSFLRPWSRTYAYDEVPKGQQDQRSEDQEGGDAGFSSYCEDGK
jgi:hypothetical protein